MGIGQEIMDELMLQQQLWEDHLLDNHVCFSGEDCTNGDCE